jgi:hypothetical protein
MLWRRKPFGRERGEKSAREIRPGIKKRKIFGGFKGWMKGQKVNFTQ